MNPPTLISSPVPPPLCEQGCGYENGEELLSVYTMAQTSFSLFFSVVVLMAMCMAWKVDQRDIDERRVRGAGLYCAVLCCVTALMCCDVM
jgi:hypothetical protein